jgi:TRAP-type transport system small permease protein
MKVLRLIDRFLDRFAQVGIILAMAAMAVVIIAQVYFRYGPGTSLAWSEEAARYLMVWLTFLGGPVALRRAEHVGVTIFRDWAPRLPRLLLMLLGQLVMVGLLAVIVYIGYATTVRNLGQPSPAMRIPVGWVTAAIPVGSALMLIEVLKMMVETVRSLLDPSRAEPAKETPGMEDGMAEGGGQAASG